MTPLSLLVCAVLSALSTQAKVVTDFKECERFFYKGTEPSGMDQNAVKICQKYNGQFHFATLYSQYHRIPLYSAYTFDRSNLENTGCCTKPEVTEWFIEPQIGRVDHRDEMRPLSHFHRQYHIKKNQAIPIDYMFTGYYRGQLLPHCYLSTENRRTTFTLTNAAPMDPLFFNFYWKEAQECLKSFLTLALEFHPSGKAYIITGTVPHKTDRIPKKDKKRRDYERVAVPTHFWTAVCFVDDSDPQNPFSFSFGFIGETSQNRTIKMYHQDGMNSELTGLYSKIWTQSIRVFVDACDFSKSRDQLKSGLQIKVQPGTELLESDFQHWTCVSFIILDRLYQVYEDVEACLLTKTIGLSGKMGRRKRDVGSESVQFQYFPEPASMTTADGTRNLSDKRYCETENGYKLCCTTPCQDHENNDDYWCYSGQTKIPCSPQYSAVTIKNEKCKEEHPCGTYGEDYYWCYKDSGSWDYCSPPLRNSRAKTGQRCRPNHACAKYGSSENWCYTDAGDKRYECCTRNNCYSAIDGKTCRPDSPCGKHGKDYLWCETTDGSWGYCCKEC